MHHLQEKKWELKKCEPEAVERLVREGIASPLLARLLLNRVSCDGTTAAAFFAPTLAGLHDPFLMLGMEAAVERLVQAVADRERVCIHGDYDVDGITSVVLLLTFFRALDIDAFYIIPDRLVDGYGLSGEAVRKAAGQGARVMVTVDCGITAVAEATLCADAGVDLVITDHHTPGDVLPDACAVINPHRAGCPYPFKSLAGVGVAFNLAIAMRSRLRDRGFFSGRDEPKLREYLDLVALGTIADVVPLVDQNRILVKHGLVELAQSKRPGVQALKKVSGITGEVGCGAVGFRLAPRLNAAGRLENASMAVELLLSEDLRNAERLAAALDAGNVERQAVEREILNDALKIVKGNAVFKGRKSIVLASEKWHPGVIGIVASRLVDLYHRPTILISLKDGNGKGSGRSIAAFHLHEALAACAEHLVKFGGHRHAAGLTIAEETLEQFVERFDQVADGLLTAEDLIPVLFLDAELKAEELTPELVGELDKMKPFGMGNPEPLFLLRDARVLESRIVKDTHLKLRLQTGNRKLDAIAFSMAGRAAAGDRIDLAFSPAINNWNGRSSLQLTVKDLRRAGGI
ncbi:single-stranded-DNA-specific exonuclease RecJ [Geotalea sp. SG265]|uniref:single-stranded-DNA-specific exonuclease RecJ n=1 Tax=Geotalea sp. SG265 TaxID=2922867 RepID=UPI001FAFC718|nr:single-stranded-DNA-specific exonuclease RecJ [Geotalea sp. SG265]